MRVLLSLVSRIWNAVMSCHSILKELRLRQIRMEVIQERIALHQLDQDKVLQEILAAVTPLPAVGFRFTITLEGQIIEGAVEVTIKNSQKFTATIQPVDAKGNPASVDGVPVWATSDDTKLVITPSADGMSAEIAGVGPIGDATVSVNGDADLGAGVKPIFGELAVTVTPGDAVGFEIKTTDPVDQ